VLPESFATGRQQPVSRMLLLARPSRNLTRDPWEVALGGWSVSAGADDLTLTLLSGRAAYLEHQHLAPGAGEGWQESRPPVW
jgi:hypothetical protein